MKPQRPELQDPALVLDVAKQITPTVLQLFDESIPHGDIVADLFNVLDMGQDGYKMAQHLERKGWPASSRLVNILDHARYIWDSLYDHSVRAWVQENQIEPDLTVGDAVVVEDSQGLEHAGDILRVDHEKAQYWVFSKSLRLGVSCLGVPYEKAKSA